MLYHTTSVSLLVGLFASAGFAQGPDILIPTGSNDGAFALADKDKDGKYTTAGESWDFQLNLTNTSPRNYVLGTKQLFYSDTIRNTIEWMWDANGDGKIDESTERHVFVDVSGVYGGLTPGFVNFDGSGWLWWVNDGGNGEGIYRSKDLNNDGDAMDLNETFAVLTENDPAVPIANTPLSGAVSLALTEIDSILWDPTWGKGRFLVEEEYSDQTVAFEDKNGDGDFNDLGEVYLFCALYTVSPPRPTRCDLDVNPDVLSGKLPVSNEIRNHAVDTFRKVYYLMSSDTNSGNTDAAIVFRGKDNNNDGDVNDAGETTIFWDGSLDSTGAVNAYNFVVGMAIDAISGRLYVNAEWNGSPDHEQLIMLEDKNNDGDANDAGETTVLWDLGSDRTHYTPSLMPVGLLGSHPVGTVMSDISYYGNATCQSSLATAPPHYHNIQYGVNGASKPPLIGNSNWTLRTWGAAATAPGALAISLTKIDPGFPLDPGGTCLVYQPFLILNLFFTTSSAGVHDFKLPIPASMTSLKGLSTYWQSIVIDAAAPTTMGFTLSDAVQAKFGDWSMTR